MVLGMLYYNRMPLPYRLLFWINVLGLFVESSGHFISHNLHQANLWLFNIYLLVDVAINIYLARFFVRPAVSKFIPLLIFIHVLVWMYVVHENSFVNFAYMSLVAASLIITILFLFILIDKVMHSDVGLTKDPLFWLCLSMILYYACDIPYMSTLAFDANDFIHRNNYLHGIDINDILNAASPLLYVFSFVLCAHQRKPLKTIS